MFNCKRMILLVIMAPIMLVACGEKDQAETTKAATQVVAKVNGDEISIHQVNFQMGRLTQSNQKSLNEAQAKEAAKQILGRLVDQQLLKQQAIEAKLDRNPNVLQALEASKNEILAQAYLEQMLAKATKPSAAQIDTFYKENPALFENRRVFRLQELAINVSQDKFAEIEAKASSTKNINEIATWLKDKSYPFNANSNVRAAEQLPLGFLNKIQSLKDGELIAVPAGQSMNIIHIAASQSAPIARDKATPIIEQYFLNQNKATLAKTQMADLNKNAKIEYVGAFADMKKESAPTTIKKSDAPVAETPTATSEAKPESKTESKASAEKPLSGF